MDAHALLTSQGWRGTGNSLHPTNNAIGLSRPLLVSKKVDNLGIGKKQHRTSDMWWLNAFDSSLKGLDTSKEGQVTQTVTSGGLDMVQKAGAKWVGSKGGLYASFVRGEMLGGTIEEESESGKSSKSGKEGSWEKKRKRGDGEETKEERRARKAVKREAKATRVEELVMEESARKKKTEDKPETKEGRRARKAAKRVLRDQESKSVEESNEDDEMADAKQLETKEERKERRQLKKLAKGADQKEAEASPEKAKKKKRRKE